jgi:Arc/MetJ family transcription regulator
MNTSYIMRTTLDIPKELIDEAMKATGATTKSQLIKDALQAEIDRAKRKRLIAKKGTVDLDIELDTLRDRD